jgi:hypothetical protein
LLNQSKKLNFANAFHVNAIHVFVEPCAIAANLKKIAQARASANAFMASNASVLLMIKNAARNLNNSY